MVYPPPGHGSRHASIADFFTACDVHSRTSEPPFPMAPRKISQQSQGPVYAIYACVKAPNCTFAFSAGPRQSDRAWTVYSLNLKHSCGLPSPFASETKAPTSPKTSRTPTTSPTIPAWRQGAALGSPPMGSAAPSSSVLANHWGWLSFDRGSPTGPPSQSPPRTSLPSFRPSAASPTRNPPSPSMARPTQSIAPIDPVGHVPPGRNFAQSSPTAQRKTAPDGEKGIYGQASEKSPFKEVRSPVSSGKQPLSIDTNARVSIEPTKTQSVDTLQKASVAASQAAVQLAPLDALDGSRQTLAPSLETPMSRATSRESTPFEPGEGWPPTNVTMPVLAPQIGSVWPSREACRAELDKAGAAAQPPFTVWTAKSLVTPPDRAFVVWHCVHRQRQGEGCSFLVRAQPKDSFATEWDAKRFSQMQDEHADRAHRHVTAANYDHCQHPPPGIKRKRTGPRMLPSVGDTSDSGATPEVQLPPKRRGRPPNRERYATDYVPPTKRRKMAEPAAEIVVETPLEPVAPLQAGPLTPFLEGLHPMLAECGPILERAGVTDVRLLLSLRDGELREVLSNLVTLKVFHKAVIANRVGQVRDGKRINPLDRTDEITEDQVKVEPDTELVH